MNQITRIYFGLSREYSALVQWTDGRARIEELPGEFSYSQVVGILDLVERIQALSWHNRGPLTPVGMEQGRMSTTATVAALGQAKLHDEVR